MAKALTITGMVVAGLVLVIFGLDLAVGVPFGGAITGDQTHWTIVDIGLCLAAGVLGYLSWSTFRELR